MGVAKELTRIFLRFADLVKFEHTIFALPFAYVGCLMAANGHPSWRQLCWVTLAMVAARTAGMAANRLIDWRIDALNPRTEKRAIPAGQVSTGAALRIVVLSLALLVAAASRLTPLALWLSPVAVFLLLVYSYLKRFTSLSHLWLGLVLGCAPAGGWIAVRGSLGVPPLLLAAAVVFWVAGFDIIYACLDLEFDRRRGLYSIPAKFGLGTALQIAKVFHAFTVMFLIGVGMVLALSTVYFVGIGVVASLLMYEHQLVRAEDLSRLDQAFFTMNGWVSVTLLVFTWLNYALGGGTATFL